MANVAVMEFPGFAVGASPSLSTDLGRLYQADCLEILPLVPDESVDAVFADPPFNLGKHYGKRVTDNQPESEYVDWCHRWLSQCVRVLRPGGSLFVYNLPRWNVTLGHFLEQLGLTFRHWIAIEQTGCLPIQGRLYPSHYSLIYYSKGRPRTFKRIRTPIETCRHCGGEIKDYGGHRKSMHPNGVNLKDVWTDIPPVRHRKFKPVSRHANSLSTKILERVIEMSTEPGDLVLDPFRRKRDDLCRLRAKGAALDRDRTRGCAADSRSPERKRHEPPQQRLRRNMPVITERRSFNGFDVKVKRLGLTGLIGEIEKAVTSFELLVQEEKYANGTKWIRQKIDEGFDACAT